jgi:hypothetical protein
VAHATVFSAKYQLGLVAIIGNMSYDNPIIVRNPVDYTKVYTNNNSNKDNGQNGLCGNSKDGELIQSTTHFN